MNLAPNLKSMTSLIAALPALLMVTACAAPSPPPSALKPPLEARKKEDPARCADPTPTLPIHRELLAELNRVRTQPAAYAALVEAHYQTLDRDNVFIEDGRRIRMKEGRPAINEAIATLRRTAPVAPLRLNGCLSRAAFDHVSTQGPTGRVGHVGEDGSQPTERATRRLTGRGYCGENITYSASAQPRDIVIQLVVDDGVPDRGHVKNLFKPDYQSVGFAVGPHARFGSMSVHLMCLNDLAGGG